MSTLLLFAPVFLVFELWQLVLSERYLGVKQMARRADPRLLGLSEVTAFFWSTVLISYWVWMLLLLTVRYGRMFGLGLLLITALGYSLRRSGGLKWALVILTFEGAFRVAALLGLSISVWHRL
jgi:hypothetical protein